MKKSNVIGENIRSIRLKSGLTQAQFAESLKKSQSTIYSYECGAILPSFDVLMKISQIYGIPIGHIMGIEWQPVSQDVLHRIYTIYLEEVEKDEQKE